MRGVSEPTIRIDDELPGAPGATRWRVLWSVAALVVAFAAGVGIGYRVPGGAPSSPTEPAAAGPASVSITGSRCSIQLGPGPALWLGAQLLNEGPGTIVVSDPRVDLPLGGMKLAGGGWTPCGQSNGPGGLRWVEGEHASIEVAENATLWMSVRVILLEPDVCPAPYPVWFTVTSTDEVGTVRELQLGFVDLGEVPYVACESEQ